MKELTLVPGSDEWLEFRKTMLGTASTAPEMLGEGYTSRAVFLRDYGKPQPAPSDYLQALFDKGHEAEDLARPVAEDMIGDELFPSTAVITEGDFPVDTGPEVVKALNGRLSASFDGITADGQTIWEHKLYKATIAAALDAGKIPIQYRIQMEQQLMISGAARCLFMASNLVDGGKMVHMWYYPDLELRDRIVAGWLQFSNDLDNRKDEVETVTPDESWAAIENEYLAADLQLAAAKERVDAARKAAEAFAGGKNVDGPRLKLVVSERTGRVAYDKVLDSLGVDVDLEKFRSKPTQYIQLRKVKQ